MSLQHRLSKIIDKMNEHEIFYSKEMYLKNFAEYHYNYFCKGISLLENKGKLSRLSRGMYYKPQRSILGLGPVPIAKNEIVTFFIGEENEFGFYADNQLHRKYALTTQVAKTRLIYSTKINTERKTIGDISIRKLSKNPTMNHIIILELLSILDSLNEIEDLNYVNLVRHLESVAKRINMDYFDESLNMYQFKKEPLPKPKKF